MFESIVGALAGPVISGLLSDDEPQQVQQQTQTQTRNYPEYVDKAGEGALTALEELNAGLPGDFSFRDRRNGESVADYNAARDAARQTFYDRWLGTSQSRWTPLSGDQDRAIQMVRDATGAWVPALDAAGNQVTRTLAELQQSGAGVGAFGDMPDRSGLLERGTAAITPEQALQAAGAFRQDITPWIEAYRRSQGDALTDVLNRTNREFIGAGTNRGTDNVDAAIRAMGRVANAGEAEIADRQIGAYKDSVQRALDMLTGNRSAAMTGYKGATDYDLGVGRLNLDDRALRSRHALGVADVGLRGAGLMGENARTAQTLRAADADNVMRVGALQREEDDARRRGEEDRRVQQQYWSQNRANTRFQNSLALLGQGSRVNPDTTTTSTTSAPRGSAWPGLVTAGVGAFQQYNRNNNGGSGGQVQEMVPGQYSTVNVQYG